MQQQTESQSPSALDPDGQAINSRATAALLAVLNALDSPAAAIDPGGFIVASNRLWQQQGDFGPLRSSGDSVLSMIQPSLAPIAEGIRAVLARHAPVFETEFCHALQNSQHWYSLKVTPLDAPFQGALLLHQDITARHQAEEIHMENENRHHQLFHSMVQGVVFQDANGVLLDANPAAEKILGLTKEQMQGRTSIDPRWRSVHADGTDFPGQDHPSMQALRTGQPVNHVIMGVYNPVNAGYSWIDISATPRFKPGETTPYQVFTTFDDITERRNAESALRESETKFATIFRNTPLCIAIVDMTGHYIDMNDAFCVLTGYPRHEAIGKFLGEMGNLDRETILTLRQLLLANGKLNNLEVKISTRGGLTREVLYSVNPILLNDSPHYMMVILDISERKRAEEANARSAAVLAEAQRLGRIGHLEWVAPNKHITLSEALHRIFEIPMDGRQITMQTLSSMVRPEDADRLRKLDEQFFKNQTDGDYEYSIILPDGQSRMVRQHTHTTFNEFGRPVRILGVIQDITEAKQAEEASRDLAEDLMLVNKVDEAALRGESFQSITDLISRETIKTFSTLSNVISILNQDGDILETQSLNMAGILMETVESAIHRPLPKIRIHLSGNDYFQNILKNRQPVLLSTADEIITWMKNYVDVIELPRIVRAGITKALPSFYNLLKFKSVLIIPLVSANQVIGIMEMSHSKIFTPKDVERIQKIGRQVTTAILSIRAEEVQRASDERYRGLMESLDTLVATIDKRGIVTYMNDRGARALNLPANEIVGRPFSEFGDPGVGPKQWDAVKPIFKDKQPRFDELQVSLNQETRWIRRVIQPIHDQYGEVDYALVNITDIHDIKQAEQVLLNLNRELEERVRERTAQVQDLYENAPVGYHSLDSSGCFIAVNKTELNWLGYTREELLGKSFTTILLPERVNTFPTNFGRLKNHGEIADAELDILRKDGSTFTVVLNSTAVYDEHGEFISSRTTMTNITARKQAEEALRSNTQLLHDIINHTPSLIYITDLEGRFIMVNDELERLMGIPTEKIIGQNRASVMPAEIAAKQNANDQDIICCSERQIFEEELTLEDGIHYYLTTKVPLLDAKGKIYGICGISTDITNHHQAQAMLLQANSELEQAMHIKDSFLANMSHELRTPLTGILGLSESLLEEITGPLSEIQRSSLDLIHSSGEHLLNLINDILDLSKIEAGKLVLQQDMVTADEICLASLAFVKEPAVKQQISLEYSCKPDYLEIVADPRRLKQILVNLLSNAVKFTLPGGKVSLQVESRPGDRATVFSVRDTGIGIAQADLARLFTPFSQIDSTLSRQRQGTGLGLSLVRKLVDLHNGTVTVESEPGKGSCFSITIPWIELSRTQLDEEIQAWSSPHLGASSPQPSRHILIAEDNDVNAQMITQYLKANGYQVSRAKNGIETLSLADQIHPDLILMDIQMPEMDGLEATAALRTIPDFAQTPIIALTALAMKGDIERCMAAGASEYLSKPVQLAQLLSVIQNLL